jgi:hypothetical protein
MPTEKTTGGRQPEKIDEPAGELVCRKCGTPNPPDAKFCKNCGRKVGVHLPQEQPGVIPVLLAVGGAYLLISLVVNSLVRATPQLWVPYAVAGVFSTFLGYAYARRKVYLWTKILAMLTVALALYGTGLAFLVGLSVRGVVGPAWVIFAVGAWRLWVDKARPILV